MPRSHYQPNREAGMKRGKTFHLDANAHFLLHLSPARPMSRTDQAGTGEGGGIKLRTDEFRQAASHPELAVGWGCLFSAPDTDTDIHLPTRTRCVALTGWWQPNYHWASRQQKATRIRPKKKKKERKKRKLKFGCSGGHTAGSLTCLMGSDRGEC